MIDLQNTVYPSISTGTFARSQATADEEGGTSRVRFRDTAERSSASTSLAELMSEIQRPSARPPTPGELPLPASFQSRLKLVPVGDVLQGHMTLQETVIVGASLGATFAVAGDILSLKVPGPTAMLQGALLGAFLFAATHAAQAITRPMSARIPSSEGALVSSYDEPISTSAAHGWKRARRRFAMGVAEGAPLVALRMMTIRAAEWGRASLTAYLEQSATVIGPDGAQRPMTVPVDPLKRASWGDSILSSPIAGVLLCTSAVAVAPYLEELRYRHEFLPQYSKLRASFADTRPHWAKAMNRPVVFYGYNALLFGGMHLLNPWSSAVVQSICAAAISRQLFYVYAKHGLAGAVGMHTLTNLLGVAMTFLPASETSR